MSHSSRPHWLTSKFLVDGFTLLEAAVVIAILSILSSIALPNAFRILAFNNVDEAKSLLNAAAADCLQRSRLNKDNQDTIDGEILANQRLSTIGYKINEEAKNCSYLELLPTSEEDEIRFPIGFSVSAGKLSKFATPTSTDAASKSSCESWAGVNCKEDQALKELIAYRKEIDAAKKACTDAFTTNTAGEDTDGPFFYWNSNATSGCPTRPPKVVSSTCTTNGCNKKTYFFEGENLRTDDPTAYDKAREAKFGAECIQWQAQQRANKTDNPRGEYTTYSSCLNGTQKFWFCDGENLGNNLNDADALKAMNNCLDAKKEASCEAARNNKIAESGKGNFNGEYTPEKGAPGLCSTTIWLCEGQTYTSPTSFRDSTCGTPPQPKCIPFSGNPWYCPYLPNESDCKKFCL